jgi:hypothetical protein
MADEQKAPAPNATDQKKTEKVNDLPERTAAEKDEQVKGGRMRLDPNI